MSRWPRASPPADVVVSEILYGFFSYKGIEIVTPVRQNKRTFFAHESAATGNSVEQTGAFYECLLTLTLFIFVILHVIFVSRLIEE